MIIFQLGETVVVTHRVQKKITGTWTDYDPATSIMVEIFKSGTPTAIVASTAMTKDSAGNYHYDFQTVGQALGKYRARVTDTDGTRIVVKDGIFAVE